MGLFDKAGEIIKDAVEAATSKKAPQAPAGPVGPVITDAPAPSAPETQAEAEAPAPTPAPAAPAAKAAPKKPAAKAAPKYRTVTVKKGDTLSGIAAAHGVDWHEMARLNNLENPDLIFPGQVFKLPHH